MKNYNDIYDAKQMVCDLMNTAYNKGYDKGYAEGVDNQLIKEAYQKGLNDAWECAKLLALPYQDGGIDYETLQSMFGNGASWQKAFMNYSASEAMAKIKEYEEKKKADEEIKVGDEVVRDGGFTAVVTRVHGKKYVAIVYDDGSCDNNVPKEKVKKTGRHFDVQNIFDQMNDEQ